MNEKEEKEFRKNHPLIAELADKLDAKGLKPVVEPVKCNDCKEGEYRCLLCIQRELDNLQSDLMEIHILEKMSATEIQELVDVSRSVLLK